MSDRRDAYVAKLKARLDKWNAKIDELEAKTQKIGADSRAELQNQIANIKEKRAEVEQKIESLRQAGDGAWKDLKAGAESSWKVFHQAVRSATTRFKRTDLPKESQQ